MRELPEGWMHTDDIRAQIREALDHEEATHTFERSLINAWRQCLHGVSPEVIEQRALDTQTYLTAYITSTPGILDAVLAASKVAGIQDVVEKVLHFAAGYFRKSVDFIPDHMGLVALVDDAYMAQRIMQAICDNHKTQTGRQILSVDLTQPNATVRALIGEPTATEMDDAIANVLNCREMCDLSDRITEFGDKIPVPIPATYPAFDPGDAEHTIRLGTLGGAH